MDGGVDDHLDAVHVGREYADKNPARRLVHDVDVTLFDGRFTGSAARAFGGGTLAQQCQNALFAEFGQTLDVTALVVQRIGVEPEVTGVEDPPDGRIDNYAGAAGDGMRDAHQFDEKFADFEPFVGVFVHGDGLELKAVRHRKAEVLKDFLYPADAEFGAVNRRREIGHDVRQAA